VSTLRCFLAPESLFGVLVQVRKQVPFVLILRRFKSPTQPAGLLVPSFDDDLVTVYVSGGFQEAILSIDAAPEGERDWDFMNRNADRLLLIEGARVEGSVLEMSTLRILAKRSRAQDLFRRIKKAVAERCAKGLQAAGTVYGDIYYGTREAREFTLRETLAEGATEFYPMASG